MADAMCSCLEHFLTEQKNRRLFHVESVSLSEEEAIFDAVLTPEALTSLLLLSGDVNVGMHHPDPELGRGITQGVALDLVYNCAVSLWKTGLPVKRNTIEIIYPCFARSGEGGKPVEITLTMLFIAGLETSEIICEMRLTNTGRKICEANTLMVKRREKK